MNDLHMNGNYERAPWGYLGMPVRIYRAAADGRVYALRSMRGVIATARTMEALSDLARRNRWTATYRAHDRRGNEIWVSIPE